MKPELGLLSNLQFLMSLQSKLSLLEVGFPGLPCQRHLGASLTSAKAARAADPGSPGGIILGPAGTEGSGG